MTRSLYNPASAIAAEKGIPTSFEKIDGPPITLETMRLPSGVTVDKVRFAPFAQVFSDFERRVSADPKALRPAIKDMAEKLADMHASEHVQVARALRAQYDRPHNERWAATRAAWRGEVSKDPEIGRNRRDTTLARVKALMASYGEAAGDHRLRALKEVLDHTGAGDNIEVIRFLHWAATRQAKGAPPPRPASPAPAPRRDRAARLYK
jgi:hypothetical protein